MNSTKKRFMACMAMSLSLSAFTLTSSVFAAPITIAQAAKNIQAMKTYNFDGGLTVSAKSLPTTTTDSTDPNMAMVSTMLSNFSITFSGKVDQKNPADVKQAIDMKATIPALGMTIPVPLYAEGDLAGTKGTVFIGIPDVLKTLLAAIPSNDPSAASFASLAKAKMGYMDIADMYKFIAANNKDAKNAFTPANMAKSKLIGQELTNALLNYANVYTTNKANKNVTFTPDKNVSEKVGGVYKISLNALQFKALAEGLYDDKAFQKAMADFIAAEKAMNPSADFSQVPLTKAAFDKQLAAEMTPADMKSFTSSLSIVIKNYNVSGFSFTLGSGTDKMTLNANVYNVNGPVSIVMPTKKDANTIDLLKTFGALAVNAAQEAQKTLPSKTIPSTAKGK